MSSINFRLFFEKDIYIKTKQTVAKMIFYVFTISTITKSEICFDTRAESEGANRSCPSILRCGTTRLFHVSLLLVFL